MQWEGRDAFGSVVVCDEACRLNGSKYNSNIGSLCGSHDHSPSHKAWEKQENKTNVVMIFDQLILAASRPITFWQLFGVHTNRLEIRVADHSKSAYTV